MTHQSRNIIDLHQGNFKQVIEDNQFVIVDFWAEWCQPCMDFYPILEQVAKQYRNIAFSAVNVDTSAEVAAFFHVKKIPAMLVIRDRIVIDAVEGFMKASELRQHIPIWQHYDVTDISNHFDAKLARL